MWQGTRCTKGKFRSISSFHLVCDFVEQGDVAVHADFLVFGTNDFGASFAILFWNAVAMLFHFRSPSTVF